MKYGTQFALPIALALILSTAAFGKTRDEGKMQLTDPVAIGATHLKPGTYKVEWNGTGNQVQLSIMQHGRTVASVPAKLVQRPEPSPYDAVVTDHNNRKVARLDEIDFNNRRDAIVLHTMAGTTAKQ